jgi:PKD repeat protein
LAATDDSPTELGQATTLTATVTAGTDVSYAWDFGDDQTGSGALVTHTYPATGAYTAVVTATNSRGEMTDTTLVTIVDVPIAGLNATDHSPTELGQVTTLTATVTAGSNVSYAWAFGDGQTGDGAVVIHTYPAEGVYTAMVTASNPVSLLTATTTVTITPALLRPGPTTLISPSGVISDTMPAYTWHAVEHASWYKLMVEERASGTKSTRWVEAIRNCAAGTCAFTQPTPLNNGEHIWWVQTYNDAGYGPWSAGLAFWAGDFIPPATPVPVAPVGANIASTPTYTWQVVPTATWYQLYVSGPLGTVTNQWVSASSSCGAGSCSVTPSITLHAGPHAWWVRAWSQAGLSPWSTRSDFFVGPPLPAPAATLIAPSGTIAATTPAYTWGVVPSATWYWLYVVEKPSNTPVVDEWYPAGAVCDGALGACAVTPTLALQDGAHSWWVKTWNPYDGAWSQNLNFTVAAGAATPLAQEVSGQQLRLYLPLVLKRGGTEEAPQPPGQELPPGVDGEGDPPVEERTPPAAPPPDIDAETGPPVVELAPSAGPPPEANEADGPPRPIR